jgi:hypothetical protein
MGSNVTEAVIMEQQIVSVVECVMKSEYLAPRVFPFLTLHENLLYLRVSGVHCHPPLHCLLSLMSYQIFDVSMGSCACHVMNISGRYVSHGIVIYVNHGDASSIVESIYILYIIRYD